MPAKVEFKATVVVEQVKVPVVLAVVVGVTMFCVTVVVVVYEQPFVGLTTLIVYVPAAPDAVVDWVLALPTLPPAGAVQV